MVLFYDDDKMSGEQHFEPYWYAWVIDIFHVMVQVVGSQNTSQPQRMDFLWVHWYGKDPAARSGWAARHLPLIGYVLWEDSEAFRFINPQDVI